MGTSLSGLTPATTFDGLLKVGDNDPLTATLKPISTGDGTDTILQLSNSAIKISGNTEIDSSGINSLIVKRNGTELLKTDFSSANGALVFTGNLTNKFSLGVRGNDFNIWDGSYLGGGDLRFSILADGKTAIGAQTPTAQLHIKGSGATSATTSLLVQNSDGTDMVKVTDDGVTTIQGNVDALGGDVAIFQNNTDPTNQFKINKKDNSNNIWHTGTTNTEIQYRDNIHFRFNHGGVTQMQLRNTGNLGLGIGGSNASARMHVKGSGATSATTSLLVQNSSGDDVFSIKDNGLFTFNDAGGGDALTIENGSNISQIRYNDNLWLGSSHGTYVPTLKIDRLNGLSVETNSGSLLNLLYDTGNLGIGETTPTAKLHVKGSGNDNTTTSLLVQNSDASASLTYDDSGKVEIVGNSQTGFIQTYGFGAVGFGNESGPTILYGNNLSGLHTNNGYTGFGANSSSSQRVLIKGSGATSATTALLVQKSDGISILTLKDNGDFIVGGSSDLGVISGGRSRFRFGLLVGDTSSSETSAVLEAKSTTQGFLPPRMTGTQRDAIESPASGLIIYNTTTNKAQCYNGTSWNDMF